MPLSEQSPVTEIEVLNNFLQASLSCPKNNSLPDINLNSLDFNHIRRKLDDSLKENIIEFIYVNQEGNLIKESNHATNEIELHDQLNNKIITRNSKRFKIKYFLLFWKGKKKQITQEIANIENQLEEIKKNNNQESVSVVQKSQLSSNIVNLQPLVIIRSDSDIAQAHLYRYKLAANNQKVLEYLGKKELPALLVPIQSPPDLPNDKADDLRSDNVNIIRKPKPIMTLSFAENGTCYLVIDSKKKTIVPTDTTDTQHFKNFVAKNCPRNGSLNIEVDESGEVIYAYTINNETAKKKYIDIKQDLRNKIQKVVATAYSLQMNISSSSVSPSSNPQVPEKDPFPAKEVNTSAVTATPPPLNPNTSQNTPILAPS